MNDIYLVVGLGSMGKRRVRDLKKLTGSRVIGIDAQETRRLETAGKFNVESMGDYDEALSLQPKAVFICVPPHLHYPLIKKALAVGAAYFVECLTVLHMEEMRDLIALNEQYPHKAYPSCTHLFLEATQQTQQYLLQAGQIYSIQANMTSWLPDQHPWEKQPGDHYEFHRSKGGGIAQIAYELSWLYTLLRDRGANVIARTAHLSNLPEGFNDVCDMILELEGGANLNYHYTLFDKHDGSIGNYERFSTEKGNIVNTYKESRYYNGETKQWQSFKAEASWSYEEVYTAELRHFLDAFERGLPYRGSLEVERDVLATILAAEESARTGRLVDIRRFAADGSGA